MVSDHGQSFPTGDDNANNSDTAVDRQYPVVAIGASAGGVDALQTLFTTLPQNLNAAFVVIVHLDPGRQSELAEILARRTSMPVTQVSVSVQLQPNQVYVIPPNRRLLISDRDGVCEMVVADTGVGIADADRDRMLQRFEKSQESAGHGLGLAIAYRLATENAIAVTMSSTIGVGTCFRLRIPDSSR